MTTTADENVQPAVCLEARAAIPPAVVHRTFVHETVVLNLETGLYHGLNPTGGRMLDALSTGARIGDVAAQLADEFRVPLADLQRDLCAFCAELASRGLLVIQSGK